MSFMFLHLSAVYQKPAVLCCLTVQPTNPLLHVAIQAQFIGMSEIVQNHLNS